MYNNRSDFTAMSPAAKQREAQIAKNVAAKEAAAKKPAPKPTPPPAPKPAPPPSALKPATQSQKDEVDNNIPIVSIPKSFIPIVAIPKSSVQVPKLSVPMTSSPAPPNKPVSLSKETKKMEMLNKYKFIIFVLFLLFIYLYYK